MDDTSSNHYRLKYLTQIFGALAISLVSISDGCVHGYSTIALPQLESNETDVNLQLTENEGKNCISLDFIGRVPLGSQIRSFVLIRSC